MLEYGNGGIVVERWEIVSGRDGGSPSGGRSDRPPDRVFFQPVRRSRIRVGGYSIIPTFHYSSQ